MGTELSGRYEIVFNGKEKEPFYGKLERIEQWKKEIEGRIHEINIFRFMAKDLVNERYFYSIDQDISVEGETISLKDTILGAKRLMRYATILMMVIDAVFMYIMYSFASAGFVLQYSPTAILMLYLILGGAFMASVIFIIYWWYSSKVSVFSLDLRPLISDYKTFLIPVYMTNSSRNPPEEYLLEIASISSDALKQIDKSMQDLAVEIAGAISSQNKELSELVNILKKTKVITNAHLRDTKVILSEAGQRTVVSYMPIIVSVVVLAVGSVILYMVFG